MEPAVYGLNQSMKVDKLNILVLHSLGDMESAPLFLRHHVFLLERNCPGHNYLYHDSALPLPNYVRETDFDLIVLDVTFLHARWNPPKVYCRIKEEYAFVKNSGAVKIAFPQDEYDCNETLDEWMCEWGVDVVYSVISEHWDVLYPKYHKIGNIRLGFTGYVDESLINRDRKPFEDRSIDIGYRAKKLPPYFGRLGETKWTIGRDVAALAKSAGLAVDVSVGDKSTLLGEAWLEFINNSKFTLGANSGSSLLDPRGKIQHDVRSYLRDNPECTFDQVEELFFRGLDGKFQFTAISPRVMEAALLDSCQILVEGDYSHILTPWEHYIPIKSDASDFEQVLEAMRDHSTVKKMIARTRSTILDANDLRSANMARKILDEAADFVTRKNARSSCLDVERVIQRYKNEMTRDRYGAQWRRKDIRRRVIRLIGNYPIVDRWARIAYSYINR